MNSLRFVAGFTAQLERAKRKAKRPERSATNRELPVVVCEIIGSPVYCPMSGWGAFRKTISHKRIPQYCAGG